MPLPELVTVTVSDGAVRLKCAADKFVDFAAELSNKTGKNTATNSLNHLFQTATLFSATVLAFLCYAI